MRTYIVRRLLLALPTLLGITMVVFGAVRFLPGNVLDSLLGVDRNLINAETQAEMAKRYGFNQNIATQYVTWIGDIAKGNFGRSFISGRPVMMDLAPRIPVTVELSLLGIILSLLVSLPVGMLAAVRQNSAVDYLARSLSIASLSVPSFWLGLVVIVFGFIVFHWTPPLQYTPPWQDLGTNLKILWVPALILGTALSGITMRYTRTTMLEVLNLAERACVPGLLQPSLRWLLDNSPVECPDLSVHVSPVQLMEMLFELQEALFVLKGGDVRRRLQLDDERRGFGRDG